MSSPIEIAKQKLEDLLNRQTPERRHKLERFIDIASKRRYSMAPVDSSGITEEEILSTLAPYLILAEDDPILGKGIDLPKFSLEDRTGKTTKKVMTIKNPLPYNSEFTSPNPEHFKVDVFSDRSYQLYMEIGWHDGSTIHSFLVEGDKIRYSNNLLG